MVLRLLFLSGPTPSAKDARNTKPVVKSYHRPDYPFYDGRQHDGVEFLQQILLESEISENGGPLNCGFWSITTCRNPLCIRQPYHTNETGGAALIVIKRPRGKSQLKDIINSQLTEDVAANCADCNTAEMAKKKELKFTFKGDYTILCLSPFHAEGRTEGNVGTVRANGFISGFDQDNIAIDGTKFRAIAAAEHIGRSLDSGHYVAYLRQPDSQWLCISDDQTPTLRPHLPLGLHNIYYVVLQKLANQNNPQDEEYHSSPTGQDHTAGIAEHLQLELLEAEFYGLSYSKDIPTRSQILTQLETMKQRASQHSCWYLHHTGEIVIFTRQEKGPYEKVPVKFNGAFGVLRKVEEDDGELETFYLVLKKGTHDYSLVFAAMKKTDWPKAESYIRGLLKPLPDIIESSQSATPSTATNTPQTKNKREHLKVNNAPVSPSTASPLKKVVRSASGLWTGTAYGIWRTSKEQSLKAILGRQEKETARPRLHSFSFHLVKDSAAHTFDLIKRIDSKTSQLVQRFEVHEVRLLEFVAEKPRRFVLVIHQAHGWFHLFAKLDVGQDPAALENALTPSSSPPSANSRDDLTPASSILQRQGELSYMSWIKWAQTRKIRHQRYPRANHSTSINSRIFLFSGDIVSLKVDMITNAANPDLLKGSGIDDHIHKAAGWDPANSDYKLRLYCKKLGGCPVGSAKVTPSFDIGSLHSGAGWIAHAVGPNCRLPFADTGKEMYETEKGRAEARRLLTSAYTAALQSALDVGAQSIALPCISTGIYGFPSPDAADIAGAAVRHFLDNRANNRLLDVVFCLYSSRDEADYAAMLPRYFPLH